MADGAEGNSGSAVLNSAGELVGIYESVLPLSPTQRDLPFTSVFLDVGGLSYIEIYSSESRSF